MLVSRADLEAFLTGIEESTPDPRAGLYGPASLSWRINRESALFVGAGRATLLQLAHPAVAYAIDQHSDTRNDPLGRFQRTFTNIFDMVFGDLDHALTSSRRLHAIHTRIVGKIGEARGTLGNAGETYQANEPDALFWVHATLVDSALIAYETILEPLSSETKDAYYLESRRFARLFGIPDAAIPESYDAFCDYMNGMFERLDVTPPAREIASFLLSPETLRPQALAPWFRTLTAGMMPEKLREPFGLRFDAREAGRYARAVQIIKRLYGVMPKRARYLPAYNDAMRRLAGKKGRDPVGRAFDALLQSALKGGK